MTFYEFINVKVSSKWLKNNLLKIYNYYRMLFFSACRFALQRQFSSAKGFNLFLYRFILGFIGRLKQRHRQHLRGEAFSWRRLRSYEKENR